MPLSDLTHIEKTLPSGASVLILDDGANITQEDRAMLQALHSRNPKGIKEHLKTLEAKGSGNMMKSFYVGYGHKSIGDCATITIFIEGVSMLCAKAIQDSKLYNGQECSTRYIDYSTQAFFNPETQDYAPNEYTTKVRKFYLKALPITIEDLKIKYPQKDESDTIYNKTIKARAFDILRGFLPAGATTNLAWSTTLRQVADRLVYLRNHPLEEVRNIADAIEKACIEMYPNSFGHKRYDETFVKKYMENEYYRDGIMQHNNIDCIIQGISVSFIKFFFSEILQTRKKYQEIPSALAICGTNTYSFDLDFASWRDLQRHRAISQAMPLLASEDFENWYIDSLPKELQDEAKLLIDVDVIFTNSFDNQYYIPMGFKVNCLFSGDIPALVYLVEIRSSKMVHPTLRKKAIEFGKMLREELQIPIYLDENDLDGMDMKRGSNDIVEK